MERACAAGASSGQVGRPLPYGSAGVEPVSEEPLPPGETIRYAHELMDQGRPFSAHEVFEARWKSGPDAERDLWQGLAQLCVGITHAERGNRTGALRLVGRARGRLERYAQTGQPSYGLPLADIIGWIRNRKAWPTMQAPGWLINLFEAASQLPLLLVSNNSRMPRELRNVVFVDGVRTPFGKAGSIYAETRADDLVVHCIRELLRRHPELPPERIDDVAIAATTQTGDQGLTIGRTAAL